MTTPEPTGLVMLSEQDCWKRLRSHDLGRLAVVVEGRPEIFPVNYEVVQKAVVFRSGVGVKLDAAKLGPVCFEIDSWDHRAEIGWSVMVQGTAREVQGPWDPLWPAVQGMSLHSVAPGMRSHAVAVHVDRISGRHFGHRDPAKAVV
ncbi:MAG: pyridoxamine 5'-phosphate oxidase family protein [Candidatus Dormibacteraeota bacterium]|nr:pyridoxamine 5'-phosphate oxidase family protein [Candidatus Dormibacteraeota bacterium]